MENGKGDNTLKERDERQAALSGRKPVGEEPELLALDHGPDDVAPHWQSFYQAVRQSVLGIREKSGQV
ncbi:hypothetical protein [Paenibacillus xanthanilyticus]|uniref:Uncharacterized protein n=1 Tax=Paenibacillus xanthanilyticus TaxID=1783531 RepID=A0ABV8JZM0_9BACL